MFDYILRLLILIPLVGGLAWGSLWLWRRVQGGLPAMGTRERPVRLVDAVSIGVGGKLAVVRFDHRDLLVAVGRTGVTLIAEARPELIDG